MTGKKREKSARTGRKAVCNATTAQASNSREATSRSSAGKRTKPAASIAKPKLLSGGNPQIAKGEGNAPVQAYIAAIPNAKRESARRLDALIEHTVPDVRKAVKWNSPFYGVEGHGWFLSFHVFTKYIKVAFFRGASLRPVPPIDSKDPNTRYFHLQDGDELDEERLVNWIRQAAALPGWVIGSDTRSRAGKST
jgi:hypothetical protein